MTSALLVIDMQEDFFRHERLVQKREALVQRTNELTEICRASGCQVIWVTQEFSPDLTDAPLEVRKKGIRVVIADTPGAAVLAEIRRDASDLTIVKKRYSAFFGTHLDVTLAERSIDRLIIAGINTHACVRSTVVDAYQRDYDVVLAKDCIDSHDSEHHDVSWRYMDGKLGVGLSNEDVRALLTDKGGDQ
ncbi:MAG: isochorismatase family cysteine hydrolase [Pseudomonadota bacterium]